MKNAPKVRCRRHSATLTINLPLGSWSCSRDFFFLLADAIGDKAWNLSASDKEDAAYLNAIADAIGHAVQDADGREQEDIANIFD